MLILFEGDLQPDRDYEGPRFAEATFDEAAAGGCHCLGCSFAGASFSDGRLRGAIRWTTTSTISPWCMPAASAGTPTTARPAS